MEPFENIWYRESLNYPVSSNHLKRNKSKQVPKSRTNTNSN